MVSGAMICVTFMALVVISANADVEPSSHGANGTTMRAHATCMKPLISGDEHNVSSEYITASTSWPGHGPDSHGPERSRLYTVKDSNGIGSWASYPNDQHQWIQVEFNRHFKIAAIQTQGRSDAAQWVKTYKLSYGNDGIRWSGVYDGNGKEKIFKANRDQNTVVTNDISLQLPAAKFLRIRPQEWHGHVSLRFEVLGCETDSCTVELWGGPLDQTNYQVSLNVDAAYGEIYQVEDFWNGKGILSGVSSAKVIGCAITMFDENGKRKCFLAPGKYEHPEFITRCGNNVVTQYYVQKDFRLVKKDVKCLSKDEKIGNGLDDASQCAKRCRAQPKCRFFAFGVGFAKGQCYWVKTYDASCPQGFQPDIKYHFYELLISGHPLCPIDFPWLEQDMRGKHGDRCRKTQLNRIEYECPDGCFKVGPNPWCQDSFSGQPCRVHKGCFSSADCHTGRAFCSGRHGNRGYCYGG